MNTSKSRSVTSTMRMLCYDTPFGPALYDMLTPADLSSFLNAMMLSLTSAQCKKYMLLWRQFFVDSKWLDTITAKGFEVSYVGADLAAVVGRVRNAGLGAQMGGPLYLDLRVCTPRAGTPDDYTHFDPAEYATSNDLLIYYSICNDHLITSSIRDDVEIVYEHWDTSERRRDTWGKPNPSCSIRIVSSFRYTGARSSEVGLNRVIDGPDTDVASFSIVGEGK